MIAYQGVSKEIAPGMDCRETVHCLEIIPPRKGPPTALISQNEDSRPRATVDLVTRRVREGFESTPRCSFGLPICL
jgi:hypothetical protein